MKLLYAIMLVSSAGACMAQSSFSSSLAEEPDCTDISVSSQVDECIYNEMVNSTILLTNEIASFETRARHTYAADEALGSELIDTVREAQDAWIEFRDRACKVEAFEIEKETSAYVTTINSCIIRMNVERVEALEQLMR